MSETQAMTPGSTGVTDSSVSAAESDMIVVDGSAIAAGTPVSLAPAPDFYAFPPTELPTKFHPQKPTDVRLFIQGTYFISQGAAGVPEGVSLLPMENDGYGNYTLGFTGPVTGWSYGEGSVGLTFQHWDNIPDLDRPDQTIYRGGFPVTLRFDFGVTHNTSYTPTVTASSEQLQQLGGDSFGEVEDALIDAYMYGDYYGLFGVGDAIQALIRGYDPSEDFSSYTYQEYEDIPYYRLSLIPWIASKDKFNTSRLFNFGEIARFGVGPSLYWMGGNEYLGGRAEIEVSALRASYGPVRADLMVNGGFGFYYAYDPANAFNSDFWEDGQFMLDGGVGAGLMITTNLPRFRGKESYRHGRDGGDEYLMPEDGEIGSVTTEQAAESPSSAAEKPKCEEFTDPKETKKCERQARREERLKVRKERRQASKKTLAERIENFDVNMDLDELSF